MNPPRLLGAVLAGGASARMGQDKATLLLPDGTSFGQAVVGTLRAALDGAGAPDAEIVVLGHGRGMPPELATIADAPGLGGPLAGLLGLLQARPARRYIVAAVDAPLMSADLLGRLIHDDSDVSHLTHHRMTVQPLPLAFTPRVKAALRQVGTQEKASLRGFLRRAQARAIPIDDDERWRLDEVNRPEQYRVLCERWKRRPATES